MAYTIEKRQFANTGKEVSILGLGTVKFGRNQQVKYPCGEGFQLPQDADIAYILDLCLEHGINLIDTAPAYATSEERLGKIIASKRHEIFLMSKAGEEFVNGESYYNFTAEHIQSSVERSLKRLNTEYLDCVLLHCNHDDLDIIQNTPAMETLAKLKEEGKILSMGASIYSLEAGKLTVDLSDAVMVSYNQHHLEEKAVIDYAHSHGKAVLIKKGFDSGHLNDIDETIRFIVGSEGVTSLIFGSINPENILSNIRALGTEYLTELNFNAN